MLTIGEIRSFLGLLPDDAVLEIQLKDRSFRNIDIEYGDNVIRLREVPEDIENENDDGFQAV
jgi:hypothetical protein